MARSTTKNEPVGLFDRLRTASAKRAAVGEDPRLPVQEAAQLAMMVEFSTIPVYLTGLYSISQPDSTAYQLLRSVVMEEMFHLNQAANILVGIGGLPRFTGKFVPQYPGYLPHANPNTTAYLGLYRASIDVFENVFAAIETPAPPHAPPQGKHYDTIAQLYEALVDAMERFPEKVLFRPNPRARQRVDIYLGKFGGKPIEVTNLETAKLGVEEIVQQGEGSVPVGEPLTPTEPWSTYNAYGMRTDGTYGPIIGTPYELSHFLKFRKVALDTANFPSTYPIISNIRAKDVTNPEATKLGKLFDRAYSIMLDSLDASFRQPPHANAPDPFFAVALPLMHQVMPILARVLMTTPAQADGNGSVGPNAAPMFLYAPDCKIDELVTGIRSILKTSSDSQQQTLSPALDAVLGIKAATAPNK